jgi:hypothetical protein
MRLAVFTALFASLLSGRVAQAGTKQFSAGSLIIPMDLCYQPTLGTGGWSGSSSPYSLPSGFASNYCPDPVPTPNDSVLKAYGLIYTTLQNSISVHYIIDPNKTSLSGVDLTVTNAGGPPVYRVKNSKATNTDGTQYTNFMTSGNTSVSFRGAPFVIDVADASAFLTILQADATSTTPQFSHVRVYWAMTNFNANEKGVLVGPPPKIALNGLDETNVQILEDYLSDAGLTTQTTTCTRRGGCTTTNTIEYWPTIGNAFTVLGNNGQFTDFTTSDALNAGGFKVVWSPHWEGVSSIQNCGRTSCAYTATQAATYLDEVMAKMAAFADAGNSTFAECIGMGTIEGQASEDSAPDQTGMAHGHFLTSATSSSKGFDANAISGGFPLSGHSGESIVTDAPTNPIVQIGDYVYTSVNGYTTDMRPASGMSYLSGVTRLLYTKDTNTSESAYNNRDIAIVGNKDGVSTKGQVVYLAGHSYAKSSLTAGERIPLNTLLFLGQVNTTVELTRSAPIVYSNGNTYLGTYVQQTQATSGFPPWTGHFREYPPSSVSGANVTAFSSVTANWDANTHITTQGTNDTRTIFTAVSASGRWTQTPFTTANASALGVSTSNITAIRKGGLGGIDHSIPAVIGPSSVAGSSTRPVVAYVGALDGMLHGILISGSATVNGNSLTAGDEVFAFIPPSQLANTVAQSGGVDGSPSVGDAFVDTGDGKGRTWHTLMAVPDGHFSGGTIDVLDITDPTRPSFVWEASDSVTSAGKTYVMAQASGAAISPIMTASGLRYAFFFATNNTGGSAGNAFNVYAVDAGTGSVIWRYAHVFTNDTTHNDVPGTVAIIDSKGDNGPADKLFFGDVEGRVWSINAADGTNATAIYDAAAANGATGSQDYPIESGVVLYRDPSNSHLDVLGVTGGADWTSSSVLSHVFKIDTTNNAATNLYNLASGERVYAVPTIYGNAAYIITSQGNLQGAIGTDFSQVSGNLIRINLGSAGGSTVLANVKAGASEVAVDASGNVVAASASGLTQNANTARDTTQPTLALQNASAKQLTTRAWLDLH